MYGTNAQYPALDVRPGDIVANNYRVEAILSRKRGMLLDARHVQFDQRVAIRLLAPVACSERDIQGFRREIRTLAKLESEHVARIIDVGEHHDGSLFLVREQVEGSSLTDAVVPGPLALSRAVDGILELGEAVQEAHSHGVVLRDLRPDHVMLARRRDGETRAKLVDFGTAKLIGEQAGPEATAVLTGSPYASPELVRTPHDVDTRTDVWSLGCILYLLLTGRAPFEGDGPQLMLAVAKGAPPPLRQLRPDLPAELDQIIGWALAKDRDRRFSTVYALAHALRPYASPVGDVIVDRIGRLAEIAKTVASQPPAVEPLPLPSRPVRQLSRRHAEEEEAPITQPPPAWSVAPAAEAPASRSSYPPPYDPGLESIPGASPSIPAVAASLPTQPAKARPRGRKSALAAICAALVLGPAAAVGAIVHLRGAEAPMAVAAAETASDAPSPVAATTPDLTDEVEDAPANPQARAQGAEAGSAEKASEKTSEKDGADEAEAKSDGDAASSAEEAAEQDEAKEEAKKSAPVAAAPRPVARPTRAATPRVSSAPKKTKTSKKKKKTKKRAAKKSASSGKGDPAKVVALVLGGKCSLAIDGRSFGTTRSATMTVSPGSHTVTCDGQSKSVSVDAGGRGVATFRAK